MLNGEVKVWYMTEEERLDYIKKHPIKPVDAPKGSGFAFLDTQVWEKGRKKRKDKSNGHE